MTQSERVVSFDVRTQPTLDISRSISLGGSPLMAITFL